MREASERELKNMIDVGIISKVDHHMDWCSHVFPVIKSCCNPLAVCWVADFNPLNMTLKRPVWGAESSNQPLRHISPTARYFCTANTISGYHQIPLDKESRKLLTIITQYGTFTYNTLAREVRSASYLFNLISDGDTR